MAERPEDETRNVLISAVIIGAIVMAFSIVALWTITKDINLDAYYTIETFFAAPNTGASVDLAQFAFAADPFSFAAIVGIVILDNLSNIIVISFVIAAVLDIIKYADIEQFINKMKVSQTKDHVIVCGYNNVSVELLRKLLRKKSVPFVLVNRKKPGETVENARRMIVIDGRFTEAETLKQAGIAKAKEIIFTSGSDIDNLVGAITAKRLNDKIKIMVRVTDDEIRSKMYRVGVDMCVLPEYLAGIEIGEKLSKLVK